MTTVYKKGDAYIRIMRDDAPLNWREEGDAHIGTMVCWHRKYVLGDEQPKESPEDYRAGLPEDRIELPIYLYEHGGITLCTSAFSCQWDSGQLGFIYTTSKRLKEMGVDAAKAEEYLRSEVEQYDHYITGNVYGFQHFKKVVCDKCGSVEEKEGDSCWGFYGFDHKESGLLEEAGITNLDEWEETHV